MKRLLFFPMALAAGLLLAAPGLQAQPSSLLSEAQRAYASGDYAQAKLQFELILAQDPNHIVAKNYMKMIAAAQKQGRAGSALQQQLRGVVIPNVDFREATLEASLDFLRQQIEKSADLKTSFVLQPGVDPARTITLRLANVPVTEVLRYIGDLAQVRFSVDQYAISVHPRTAETDAPAAAPAAP
ncbi:MAG TPA: hypothetical protein VNQ90_15410 [Chthoniobacteraceae bacterium]|nr:hypothetical protein [Chthoniobacteraceae bacterium]